MYSWRGRRRGGGRGGRSRARGCLLLVLLVIVVLIVLSVMFGGFQKGTKSSGVLDRLAPSCTTAMDLPGEVSIGR